MVVANATRAKLAQMQSDRYSAERARTYWGAASFVLAVGLTFRIAALSTGFIVDDFAHLTMVKGTFPAHRAALDLFTLVNGSPSDDELLRGAGFLPWWAHPALKVSLFRPLASALIAADVRLLGDAPFAYHVHGAAWWLAMMLLWAAVLRRILPPRWALLALAFCTAHAGHGMLLAWIANRNAMVAMTFALLGFWAQLRARQEGWRPGGALSAVSYVLSLCASEYALAFFAYPVFYALGADVDPSSRRRRIIPWALLLAGYVVLRASLGFGTHGSGMYLDPTSEPAAFLRAAVVRLPVLAGDLVLGVRSDWWNTGFPWAAGLARVFRLPDAFVHDLRPWRDVQEEVGVVALLILLLVIRTSQRPIGAGESSPRFAAFGLPFSLLPVLGGAPEGRLLLPALFGWTIALSQFTRTRVRAPLAATKSRSTTFAPAAAIGLWSLGMLLPPLYAAGESANAARFYRAVRASILAPELDRSMAGGRVLLFGAADPTTTIYVPLVRRWYGRPAPESCQLLTSTFAVQRLSTLTSRSFAIERVQSEYTAADAYASAFNGDPLREGQIYSSRGMRVTVERVEDGRPMRARYELDVPLDDPSVALLVQTVIGLKPIPFPPVGQSLVLGPPVPPFALM